MLFYILLLLKLKVINYYNKIKGKILIIIKRKFIR